MITASVLMQLQEEGALTLDDLLSRAFARVRRNASEW